MQESRCKRYLQISLYCESNCDSGRLSLLTLSFLFLCQKGTNHQAGVEPRKGACLLHKSCPLIGYTSFSLVLCCVALHCTNSGLFIILTRPSPSSRNWDVFSSKYWNRKNNENTFVKVGQKYSTPTFVLVIIHFQIIYFLERR